MIGSFIKRKSISYLFQDWEEECTFYWSANGALAWAMGGNSVFGLCSKGTMSLDGEY